MRLGSLFSGYGGLEMAVNQVFGSTTAWVSDIERGPNLVLKRRFPGAPNLGDITKVNWSGVEPVDILTGGFPCQDLSTAGLMAGLKPGTRSGLWLHMAHAIDSLKPGLVVIENVRGILSAAAHSGVEPCPWCMGAGGADRPLRALGAVLGDLADLGYDARWCGLRAADVGAPHGRFRVFIVAHSASNKQREQAERRVRPEPGGSTADAAHTNSAGSQGSHDKAGAAQTRRRRHAQQGAHAAADPRSLRWPEGWKPTTGKTQGGRASGTHSGRDRAPTNWGVFREAVERWERILGRTAPPPTRPGPNGKPRLNPALVEWMMGLPEGHVTHVPGLSRSQQLMLLGNGVVPQQAVEALRRMGFTAPTIREASSQ